MTDTTVTQHISDREVTFTHVIRAPVAKIWQAWTDATLFRQWWVPQGAPMTLEACELDIRTGGGYKLVFAYQGSEMAFFGKYLDVVAESRLAWTNDEAGEAGQVTTLTLEDLGTDTRVVLRERFPTQEALDEAAASGSLEGTPVQFAQLAAFVTGS